MTAYLIVYFDALKAFLGRIKTDVLFELVGLALVAYGVGLIFLPAGVITGGAALCFLGYATGSDTE